MWTRVLQPMSRAYALNLLALESGGNAFNVL